MNYTEKLISTREENIQAVKNIWGFYCEGIEEFLSDEEIEETLAQQIIYSLATIH
nr:hypothetical protein [Achromobacter ruhlandii]